MAEAQAIRRERVSRELIDARTGTARRVLADLDRGCEVLVMTHGQFSVVNALVALLEQTGPADVSMATWTAAGADLTLAEQLLRSGRIRSIRFLVDNSFIRRQPGYCAVMRELFGDGAIRTTKTHAKMATIRGGGWNLALRTSMNMNHCARLETLEISDDPALADFIDAQFDAVWEGQPPGVFSGELPAVSSARLIPAGVARL